MSQQLSVFRPQVRRKARSYAAYVIGFYTNRRKQFKWKGTIRTVITAFGKLWSQLRLGMELDAINARIQDISESLWTNS
ncbi:hypothetical protein CK203_030192 [Vitis vinifera]|uniref:Uncharacterized protein n=1 Tax=Vitis vinifera TaxID=29760 RepID=A0A438I5N7_VITVI|nr:hypothetical protein CK203_030192 [Vitis vinifera]